MTPEWRIYYSDGTTFDSTQGTQEDAPARGFLCAIGYNELGERYIMHGWDHYWWDRASEQWWGCDRDGLIDQLCENRVWAYKMGRTVTKLEWDRVILEASYDPDFPMVKGGRA